ncbi:RNA polymerase subunit sigma-24, partial [Streptomyces achromogenes]
MYPHVGVDASGLATLRATVATVKETLRGFVPTAYAVPAFAAAAPAGPCYALADGGAAVGRRGRASGAATAEHPTTENHSHTPR